jgi:hypothetical protein
MTTACAVERALDRFTRQVAEEERIQAARDRASRLEEQRILGLAVGDLLAEQDTLRVRLRDVASERSISGTGEGLSCTLDLRAIVDLIALANAKEDTAVLEWRRQWGHL